MKRLLSLTAILLYMMTSYAQGIAIDKVEEDGSRSILTGAINIYSNAYNGAAVQLVYAKTASGYYNYCIRITLNEYKMQINEGRKLLLKFDDDSIMELENFIKIGPTDYTYKVTKYRTNYYVAPNYSVTEEQLEKIASKNVVKIRIENNIESIDREIKKNKFSEAIKKLYAIMQKELAIEKDIYTGF